MHWTSKEENIWRYVLRYRTASVDTIASATDSTPSQVQDLLDRVASDEHVWRNPASYFIDTHAPDTIGPVYYQCNFMDGLKVYAGGKLVAKSKPTTREALHLISQLTKYLLHVEPKE